MSFGGKSRSQEQVTDNSQRSSQEQGIQGGVSATGISAAQGSRVTANITDAGTTRQALEGLITGQKNQSASFTEGFKNLLGAAGQVFTQGQATTRESQRNAASAFTSAAQAITSGKVQSKSDLVVPLATLGVAVLVVFMFRKGR